MKSILVYVDEGAGPRSVRLLVKSLQEMELHEKYSVKRINHETLRTTEWEEETALLIFPGGRDSPYHKALKGELNQRIRNYVEQGGSYLGFCAGAYYGSSKIEFEKGLKNEIIDERELGFFPGLARGSVYGSGRFSYEDESGGQVAHLQLKSGVYSAAYYNGGCEFVDAELYSNITILAKYSDLENEPAAIVHCEVNKGQAILSGVHPEYAVKHLASSDPTIQKLLPQLEEVEKVRRTLFQNILLQLLD